MLDERLIQIGFNPSEAKVYLEFLKIGAQPVSVIAKRLRINRTTTYSILRELVKKGMMSSYNNGGMRVFQANDPNSLVAYLDSRSQTFEYYKSEILTMIPKFRDLKCDYNFKHPVVSYFEGMDGVKQVMYDSLEAKSNFCAYLSLDKWLQSGMKEFLIEYKNFRLISKKVPMRAIAPDTKEVRAFFRSHYDPDDKMTEILYVKDRANWNVFENEMKIYDDKVTIIHLDKGNEYAVVIESKEIANMQRAIFEMAWRGFKQIN